MSEGTLGIMNLSSYDEVSWEIIKTPQLKKSYSILSGVHFKNSIILAGECSNIYNFSKNSLIKYFPEDLWGGKKLLDNILFFSNILQTFTFKN